MGIWRQSDIRWMPDETDFVVVLGDVCEKNSGAEAWICAAKTLYFSAHTKKIRGNIGTGRKLKVEGETHVRRYAGNFLSRPWTSFPFTCKYSDLLPAWQVANEIAKLQVSINSNNSSSCRKKIASGNGNFQPDIESNEYSISKKYSSSLLLDEYSGIRGSPIGIAYASLIYCVISVIIWMSSISWDFATFIR